MQRFKVNDKLKNSSIWMLSKSYKLLIFCSIIFLKNIYQTKVVSNLWTLLLGDRQGRQGTKHPGVDLWHSYSLFSWQTLEILKNEFLYLSEGRSYV